IKSRNYPYGLNSNKGLSESTSVFNQIFPFAGKLERTEVKQTVDGELKLTGRTNYNWYNNNLSNHSSANVYFVPLKQSSSFSYDYDNSTDIIRSSNIKDCSCGINIAGYDNYGNLLCENETSEHNTQV